MQVDDNCWSCKKPFQLPEALVNNWRKCLKTKAATEEMAAIDLPPLRNAQLVGLFGSVVLRGECPACGQRLKLDDSEIEQHHDICPGCFSLFLVPEALVESRVKTLEAEAAAKEKAARRKETQFRMTLYLSALLLVAAFFLSGSGNESTSTDEPRLDPPSTNGTPQEETESLSSSTPVPPRRSWPELAALSHRVDILFALERVDSSHVRMDGKTNLPAGTNLMTSIEGTHERYGHSDKVNVQADGTFTATFGRVQDGQYTAEVLMPILAVQPPATQSILGKEGQNVKGPLREQGKLGVVVRRVADVTISRGHITGDYRISQQTSDPNEPDHPSEDQWAEWMSDSDLERKKEIYSRISGAWAAADKEARQKGLLGRREQLSQAPVDLDELDKVERQIEEIEDRKFRELAADLEVPFHYLRAINMKGANEGW